LEDDMKDSLPKLAPGQNAALGLRAYSRGKDARKRQHASMKPADDRPNPS